MSMTSIPPMVLGFGLISIAGQYVTLDAQNEKMGHCGCWLTPDGASRTVTHVCFGVYGASGTETYTATLESIDTSTGLPNGIIASGASGTVSVSGSGWYEVALSTSYNLASGTYAAVTIEKTEATSIYIRVSKASMGWTSATELPALSWTCDNTGGSMAKSSNRPNAALKCSDGTYLLLADGNCQYSDATTTFSTSSNPYQGNKLVAPVSVRLCGVRIKMDPDYTSYIKLLDASGNVLKADDSSTDMSIAIDPDLRGSTSGATSSIAFPYPKTLTASTAYYLMLQNTSSSNQTLYKNTFSSNTFLKMGLRLPSTWTLHRAYCTTPGSYTEVNTDVVNIYPIFDQIDIGSSGGGLPILGGSVVR